MFSILRLEIDRDEFYFNEFFRHVWRFLVFADAYLFLYRVTKFSEKLETKWYTRECNPGYEYYYIQELALYKFYRSSLVYDINFQSFPLPSVSTLLNIDSSKNYPVTLHE